MGGRRGYRERKGTFAPYRSTLLAAMRGLEAAATERSVAARLGTWGCSLDTWRIHGVATSGAWECSTGAWGCKRSVAARRVSPEASAAESAEACSFETRPAVPSRMRRSAPSARSARDLVSCSSSCAAPRSAAPASCATSSAACSAASNA